MRLVWLGGLAAVALATAGCRGPCGTTRYDTPERKLSDKGQFIDSIELCGDDYGTFGTDEGGGMLWLFMTPEFGNVVGAATWDIVAEVQVDAPSLNTFPLELTVAQMKVGGRGRWTDGETTTHDVAVLQKGTVKFTSRSMSQFGDPIFHTKWDLEFGDPAKPDTASYVFHGEDEVKVLKGF